MQAREASRRLNARPLRLAGWRGGAGDETDAAAEPMPGDEAGSEKGGVTRAGRRLRWGGAVMRCSIGDVSAGLAKAGEGVLEARAKGNIF